MSGGRHLPVMLGEVLKALGPRDGETYLDGTFGAGGYSRAILEAAGCRVIALDRDPAAFAEADRLASSQGGRLVPRNACFGDLARVAAEVFGDGRPGLDGVVLDIGVSSMQLDQAERGFSFQDDGPLDMRMSQSGLLAGKSAADFVNSLSEEELANILFHYGEERRSRAIARAIVARRTIAPLRRTRELSDIVVKALGRERIDGRHAATRTFQALRIAVNDELGELERGLYGAEQALRAGGRLVVVTFHSLEASIVKTFLSERTGRQLGRSRHLPEARNEGPPPTFQLVAHKVITPSEVEITANWRARSAQLRWAVRTEAPPWPEQPV